MEQLSLEVTWSIKCLLHKMEDLSSDPRTLVKPTTGCTCNASAGEVGTLASVKFAERACLRIMWRVIEDI